MLLRSYKSIAQWVKSDVNKNCRILLKVKGAARFIITFLVAILFQFKVTSLIRLVV